MQVNFNGLTGYAGVAAKGHGTIGIYSVLCLSLYIGSATVRLEGRNKSL
jgi:hypothetical protein